MSEGAHWELFSILFQIHYRTEQMSKSVSWEPECFLWEKGDTNTQAEEVKEEPSGDLKAKPPW